MKLSQASREQLLAMTWEQKWDFHCAGIRDEGLSAEIAIVLGGGPVRALERAKTAAKL